MSGPSKGHAAVPKPLLPVTNGGIGRPPGAMVGGVGNEPGKLPPGGLLRCPDDLGQAAGIVVGGHPPVRFALVPEDGPEPAGAKLADGA